MKRWRQGYQKWRVSLRSTRPTALPPVCLSGAITRPRQRDAGHISRSTTRPSAEWWHAALSLAYRLGQSKCNPTYWAFESQTGGPRCAWLTLQIGAGYLLRPRNSLASSAIFKSSPSTNVSTRLLRSGDLDNARAHCRHSLGYLRPSRAT